MSVVTLVEATDIMLEVVHNTIGSDIPVMYENKSGVIPTEGAWARATIRHAGSSQDTLSNDSGGVRFEVRGIMVVQLFFPLGKGLESAYTIAETLVNVLRKYKSEVWFRNSTWEEVGPDGKYYQLNITTQFQYTQLR